MTEHIKEAVVAAISRQKAIPASEIQGDSTLRQLGISSLDAITIVYEIEDAFDIEVPNEAMEGLNTVDDIVAGIDGLLTAKK
jgi:acyl carrier protein